MYKIKCSLAALLLFVVSTLSAQKGYNVEAFDKVIVSPHIQTTFVESNTESVTVESSKVDENKIHVEVNGKTLRIYLEGAKDYTKNEKNYDKGYEEKNPLYRGTVLIVKISYKTLTDLSLRGEEKHICESPLKGESFDLKIYGESDVTLNSVDFKEMNTTIYGESNLRIKNGAIADQKYTAYGEGVVNSLDVKGTTAKVVAYGEAEFSLNVKDRIKVTAFGEAAVHYKGSPVIDKGLHFGDLVIDRID